MKKDGLLLIEDSRQQIYGGDKHANIHRYCEQHGIPIVRQALSYGDYALCAWNSFDPFAGYDGKGRYEPDMSIVVDTKQDIMELATNVCSRDHRRFRDCCLRAQADGNQLIILVEEVPPMSRLDMWESPVWHHSNRYHTAGQKMTQIKPETLRKTCITMQEKYGVKFRFCDGRQTGRQLIDYLTGVRN
jgi:ribosome-associated protein